MGLIFASRRPGEIAQPVNEVKRLQAQARLPTSSSASFMQLIGIILILLSIFALAGSVAGGVGGIIAGGFIIAAGHLQQVVFDIRTLMLRQADKQNSSDNSNA